MHRWLGCSSLQLVQLNNKWAGREKLTAARPFQTSGGQCEPQPGKRRLTNCYECSQLSADLFGLSSRERPPCPATSGRAAEPDSRPHCTPAELQLHPCLRIPADHACKKSDMNRQNTNLPKKSKRVLSAYLNSPRGAKYSQYTEVYIEMLWSR